MDVDKGLLGCVLAGGYRQTVYHVLSQQDAHMSHVCACVQKPTLSLWLLALFCVCTHMLPFTLHIVLPGRRRTPHSRHHLSLSH